MPVRKLEDAHRLFVEAFNAADLDALIALYEPDATLLNSSGEPATGHAAIREALRGFLAAKPQIKLQTRFAIQSGDIALLRSHWEMTGTGPDGKPRQSSHDSAEVIRRQPDGTWLYVVDHPFGADQ